MKVKGVDVATLKSRAFNILISDLATPVVVYLKPNEASSRRDFGGVSDYKMN